MNISFWQEKKVFITGHTGFKGAWLCHILLRLGAHPIGYALEPPTAPSLFSISGLRSRMPSIIGDIRDNRHLTEAVEKAEPEFVIHMAAQPIVRKSYSNPAETYEVNVMGTVNILEAVRKSERVRSVLNVTTDKVYRNNESHDGYVESDVLDGNDPYSNSKSCSELITRCYADAFLSPRGVAVSTARSGNVIGGGDYAKDRIIPDCIRAAKQKAPVILRNPHSIRPYQHVLEPLAAYLLILHRQYQNPNLCGAYNVGPVSDDYVTTGELAELFCQSWGEGQTWEHRPDPHGPDECSILRLDCEKIRRTFGWHPTWNITEAVAKTVAWAKQPEEEEMAMRMLDEQINAFFHHSST